MNQVIQLAVMLDTVELNGIQANWRTDELGALNEQLAAFGTMRIRHLRGRYEKIGTLQISEKWYVFIVSLYAREVSSSDPTKKLKTVEEYPTDCCVYFLGAPGEFRTVETLYHVQARLAPAPVVPHPVPVVLPFL